MPSFICHIFACPNCRKIQNFSFPMPNVLHFQSKYARFILEKSGESANTRGVVIMQPKQKLVAGLLGIFLGAWGVHQFYLGDNKKGIIRIIVTVVTCGIGGIWGFIEGILILCGNINTDAQGNPLV